ncbi:uncharacterized protein L201_005573 [Kwoniella dendrophila CBS 6074]|uniref:Ras-GAP domain-containing protein n=1 Tax=Kwoniella dendrophila CBS 6074 TaxID=1295534 RepID=A0AAX4JZD9_9TREE
MPSVFQAEVNYCLTTCNNLPPSQNNWESSTKKRSSGLSLLRPKSTHGGPGRNAIVIPEPMMKPLASYPIPPPPSKIKGDGEDEDWNSDKFDTQRATLRHARSIPQLPPLSTIREAQKRITSSSSKWRKGVIVIHVHGDGGSQGGGLTIYDNDDIVFRRVIRPLPTLNWSNDDIQRIDPSVYAKPHVLSLNLPDIDQNPYDSRKSTSRGRSLREQVPSMSRFARRPRGYTVTKVNSNITTADSISTEDSTQTTSTQDSPDYSSDQQQFENEEILTSETSLSLHSISRDRSLDKVLLLEFYSEKEKHEWFTLFRSFGGTPLPRLNRSLHIKILDLQENVPFSNLNLGGSGSGSGKLGDEDSTLDQLSLTSKPDTQASETKAAFLVEKSDPKPGWAIRERLKVEIYTDKQMIGQTTWAQAEDRSQTPFWAEVFNFENMRDFSACTLRISKLKSGKTPYHFATVDLPLVPGMMKAKDERFPIISSAGHIIGELRLVINFRIVNVVGMQHYPLPEVFHGMGGTKTIYYMMSKGLLDQCIDLFTRFNWALGTTYNRLVEMSEIEAKASGDTLFRGNTPMTRLLEATMRLVCFDFLRLSIGPTINYILEHEIEVSNGYGRTMNKLLNECWENMYAQRGIFPNILRRVFSVMFKNVKENHNESRLRYKAVSSFLFLRLIGPALMRPNLFGLSRGLPKGSVQKTLTLIAKIFHTMAFFTWNDSVRDPELSRYTTFIRNHEDGMVDYLSSFATPLDDFQCKPEPPTNIAEFLGTRLPLLPPEYGQGVPMLTVAGPVEVDADAAVFYELLYQRRKAKVGGAEMTQEDGVVAGEEEEMVHLIRTMDQFISGIHLASYEHIMGDNSSSILSDPREAEMMREKEKEIERQLRPITPRPSLQIDVTSAQRDRNSDLSKVKSNLPNNRNDLAKRNVSNPGSSSCASKTQNEGLKPNGVSKWLNFGWMSPTIRPAEWNNNNGQPPRSIQSRTQHQADYGYVHGDNPVELD